MNPAPPVTRIFMALCLERYPAGAKVDALKLRRGANKPEACRTANLRHDAERVLIVSARSFGVAENQ
jgi:hypothetical protein